jgi:hypothetical protein
MTKNKTKKMKIKFNIIKNRYPLEILICIKLSFSNVLFTQINYYLKKFFKIFTPLLFKGLIIYSLICFNLITFTGAYVSDTEISPLNSVSSSTLNFDLTDSQGLPISEYFIDTAILPSQEIEKSVIVEKNGEENLDYKVHTIITGGDADFCSQLDLEATLNGVVQYSGLLENLDINPYFLNDSPDNWTFLVKWESGDSSSQGKSCQFNFVYYGWQIDSDGTWGFNDMEILTNTIAVDNWDVVLNEILYDPIGTDTGSMPGGEWIELYNNTDVDIDANNWQIKDLENNTITVSTTNCDNNLNPSDSGETIIPAHGWLTVYRNGGAMLNNFGDTVYLYNDIGTIIDQHTYIGGKIEGNTEARIPDGTGSWIDPLPTPGRSNISNQSELDPQIRIFKQDNAHVIIGIFDAINYQNANYDLTYHHKIESGQEVEEIIQGSASILSQEVRINDIHLGTCSGDVCIDHINISNVELTTTLKGSNISNRILNTQFSGDWKQ